MKKGLRTCGIFRLFCLFFVCFLAKKFTLDFSSFLPGLIFLLEMAQIHPKLLTRLGVVQLHEHLPAIHSCSFSSPLLMVILNR
jgi:hypothetical protein